jgi:Holliday junction resolvase RusA-like endonuclease
MIAFTIPGEAVPWARAGGKGKVRFTPKKQASFMGVLKLFGERAMAGRPPLSGAIEMKVAAVYAKPASWSRKKAAETSWKTSRPDADNLSKIVADALNSLVFLDDAQVASLHVWKTYGPQAQLRVEVREIA